MTPTRAYGLLLLVTLMWAGNFPLGKLALLELGPLTLSAARAALAAPVLVLIARLAHGPFPAFTRRDHWTFVVISLTGLVGNTTVWYWGLRHTSPVNAGILGASAPVIVALAGAACWYYQGIRVVGVGRAAVFMNLIPFIVIGLSWLILGEPIRWYHFVGATVAIGGVALATAR
ncbi:MAG TPA: hypothetical protein DCQ64_20500 [Candidatus Rokubacteria bacterium]|nr:MAG: hypothetical protein A2X50_09650 [Candidatus Rokubacteria bacterium GWF2_70_14]HAM57661.1 hypothetical protein [Candidatus Rokubacteria bacterium]